MLKKIEAVGMALLALTIGVIALIGLLLFLWHIEEATPWRNMDEGDWGTWVGAIGAIAALFSTIHLATTETRRRHTDELLKARLHAVSMNLRALHAQFMLGQIADKFSKMSAADSPHDRIARFHENFKQIEVWKVEDLVPLIPLPDQVAPKLAQAADEMRVVGRVLKQLDERYAELATDKRMKLIAGLHPNMAKTSVLIEECLVSLRRAIAELGLRSDR